MKEIREKWEELDENMLEVITDYLNNHVTNAYGAHGEFFQLMDDIVLPILEECVDKGVINDRHLEQHFNELKTREESAKKSDVFINSIRSTLKKLEDSNKIK